MKLLNLRFLLIVSIKLARKRARKRTHDRKSHFGDNAFLAFGSFDVTSKDVPSSVHRSASGSWGFSRRLFRGSGQHNASREREQKEGRRTHSCRRSMNWLRRAGLGFSAAGVDIACAGEKRRSKSSGGLGRIGGCRERYCECVGGAACSSAAVVRREE
jgi:hypothetical protein